MNAIARLSLGVLLVIVGLVLALGFAEAEFLWFTGRPLGVVIAILGVFDIVQGIRSRPDQSGQQVD